MDTNGNFSQPNCAFKTPSVLVSSLCFLSFLSSWFVMLVFVSGICQALEAFRLYHNFIDLLICMRQVVRKKITQCGLAVESVFAGQYVAVPYTTVVSGSYFPRALLFFNRTPKWFCGRNYCVSWNNFDSSRISFGLSAGICL